MKLLNFDLLFSAIIYRKESTAAVKIAINSETEYRFILQCRYKKGHTSSIDIPMAL